VNAGWKDEYSNQRPHNFLYFATPEEFDTMLTKLNHRPGAPANTKMA